jgi:hypothetical protein
MGSRGSPTRRDPRAFLIGGTHEATPYCVWGVGGGGGTGSSIGSVANTGLSPGLYDDGAPCSSTSLVLRGLAFIEVFHV